MVSLRSPTNRSERQFVSVGIVASNRLAPPQPSSAKRPALAIGDSWRVPAKECDFGIALVNFWRVFNHFGSWQTTQDCYLKLHWISLNSHFMPCVYWWLFPSMEPGPAHHLWPGARQVLVAAGYFGSLGNGDWRNCACRHLQLLLGVLADSPAISQLVDDFSMFRPCATCVLVLDQSCCWVIDPLSSVSFSNTTSTNIETYRICYIYVQYNTYTSCHMS